MRSRELASATARGVMPHAVVIGLDSLPGIQAARILARRGVPAIAVARRGEHYCCRTNVCERIVIGETRGPELIPLLQRIGAELGEQVVLVPCTDVSVRLLSRYRAALGPRLRLKPALWSWRDPLPFLADVGVAALRGTRHLFHGG